MSESQYSHYKDLPRQSLGLMSNQIWRDDPKMLGIHLARYKFVAKMLAGKKLVAEVGCGDGFYSQVVAQEGMGLYLYDFDRGFISDAEQRWLKIYEHNILDGKLPHAPFDAIYSLDVMEHIHPRDEKAYLENIKASLAPQGVFIIGMPSLESQKYASEASRIGHVNCQSGSELKKTLEGYFNTVFLFSMHDEIIGTAFYPMAHYILAICVC